MAARLRIGGEWHEAYLFPGEGDQIRYFHRDGSSLERQFLRAPLSFTRISSGFSSRRLHPILKVRRPHYGVDYAAPAGTPVLATADGRVIRRARERGAGRYIKLRHPGRIETTYMHLSRWARGTAVGQRVRKGQTIGYVGSSGLSTGPHLDYRIQVNGRYADPRRFSSPPGEPLPAEEETAFAAALARYDSLWEELGTAAPPLRALSLGETKPASSE
jgi:murein DD-endopeptidase MepM/ murein hydrolase activator NlpD